MIKFHIPSTPIAFQSAELIALQKVQQDVTHRLINDYFYFWESTLRSWFRNNYDGMPTDADLQMHGLWLIPNDHKFDIHRVLERTFSWRGQRILTGYLDLTTGTHHINDVAPPTSQS